MQTMLEQVERRSGKGRMMTQNRLDPERINQLLGISTDRMRELEQALTEAQKAMTMLAAAIASVRGYLPEEAATDEADWQMLNKVARG
jgi:hypothetical protein